MHLDKPRVLIFTRAYLPGYRGGGPIQSVANMVAALKHECAFSIITSSWDVGASGPYAEVPEGRWFEQDGVRLLYLPPSRAGLVKLVQALLSERPDYLYFNGMFEVRYTLLPLSLLRLWPRRPRIILAPRGMLGPGALSQKRRKKALFMTFARQLGLFGHLRFHATATDEAHQIMQHFGPHAEVHVAGNLLQMPNGSGVPRPPKIPGSARFFFLSRVDRKKNVEFALQVLEALPPDVDVHFAIIGPEQQPEYGRQLRTRVAAGLGERVTFVGPIPHARIGEAVGAQHFLLLPTLDENYGHAILESLLHGCPVVISEHTPWRNLQEADIGWDLPLRPEPWLSALQQCIAMDQTEFNRMSDAAKRFAARVAGDPRQVAASRALFT